MEPTIIKVYPTAEELSNVNSKLNCPECSDVFHSESNLNMHLAKKHKQIHLLQSSPELRVYHCPIATCNYNATAHFKLFKYVKQHYLKVHADKNYTCDKCNASFATEAFRNRHTEYCNICFQCCDCDGCYASYETLMTHSRRKKHRILEKLAYKSELPEQRSDTALGAHVPILPKASFAVLIRADSGSQTDRQHRKTQTILPKLPPLTVETQTSNYYLVKKPKRGAHTQSSDTQTPLSALINASCNTSFGIEEALCAEQSAIGTQTSEESAGMHDSITDTSDLLNDTLDTNYFNMETQTDFMFEDEILKYCDDYTNICTQTCDDLLLGDIALNNIQTQTMFDVLRSVESQTVVSQWQKMPLSCKDMSHMETQTDMEFKQMLEEINA